MRAFVLTSLLAFGASACTVWADDRSAPQAQLTTPAASSVSTAATRVTVDANRTLNAVGGGGVGVFVEYKKGGNWRVAMSCDTDISAKPCAFHLKVSAAAVDDPTVSDIPSADVSSDAVSVTINTTVSSAVPALQLKTEPGAAITVEASVDNVTDPAMYFYVAGGKLHGGDSKAVSNPLSFVPSAP